MDTNDGISDDISFQPPQLPTPSVPGPAFGPPSASGPGPLFIPRVDAPTATVVAANTVGKRGKGKVIGGLIVVVALVGAGAFAVSKIVAGNDGGAANPTEVGTRLMDALAQEDVLGVVDLLLPGEREMMRQPLIDMVDHLKRLEIVDESASLEKVGGLDIAFADVHVVPKPTNVDDVSDIRITATGTVSVDGEQVPIGQLLLDEAFGGERPDLDSDPQDSDLDWQLAAVKDDGRWYLSAFYSIAENIRITADDVPDIPESPVVARGADTPDGAVQAIFDAVDDLDLEGLIAALNPNEAEALQRYAPMFVDDAQSALDKLDVDVKFSDIKLTVTGTGDRRTVSIDGFTMHGASNGDEVTVESKDGCLVVTTNDTDMKWCQGDTSIDDAITALGLDNEAIQALVKTVGDAFADLKPVGLTVQQVDGKWFLSPIGTGVDMELALMAALDKGELTDIIDGVRKVAESVTFDDIFAAGGDVSGLDDEVFGSSGLDACYMETDFDAFSTCLASGIDDGTIDASFVAPYFRFPDCGVGEQYFDGSVYTMSDEEFTAFATNAAPCFQQYVDDGSVSAVRVAVSSCRDQTAWRARTGTTSSTRPTTIASSMRHRARAPYLTIHAHPHPPAAGDRMRPRHTSGRRDPAAASRRARAVGQAAERR